MGRQKKREIDSVLEQLKKTYADSINDELEDSLLESEKSEEDAELSAILEKIFSFGKKSDGSSGENDDTKIDSVTSFSEGEDGKAPQEKSEITVSENEAEAQQRQISESETGVNPPTDNKTEEDRVDDVLRAMLRGGQSGDINVGLHADALLVSLDTSVKNEQIVNDDVPEGQDLHSEGTSDEEKTHLSEYCEPSVISEQDNNDFIAEEELFSDEINSENQIPASQNKILNPEDYVFDPMQVSTNSLSFFKPENDLVFSNDDTEPIDKISKDNSESISNTRSEMSDNDISLMMKFGYENEICSDGQSAHANTVIFDNSKKYVPEKHKIIHGYIGKEFSSRSQIPEIEKKYKNDKLFLLIRAVLVSIIALVVTVLDIASLFPHVESNVQLSFYLFASLLVGIILIDKIYRGASSLIKFDPNEYSMTAIILFESIACSFISIIVLQLVDEASFLPFGGYPLIYASLAVWAEYIDCVREMNTFAFLSDDKIRYVAEKRSYSDDLESENRSISGANEKSSGRYFIKQSDFISGYFRKITEGKSKKLNAVAILGILPIISIISGLANTFLNGSITFGISVASYILFLSVPISSAVSLSLINYMNYTQFRRCGSAVIGQDSVEELSNAKSLIFEDTDVIEILSCTEISPDNGYDKPKKWLNISRSVFLALGGPLAKAAGTDADNGPNVSHDVSINSISDNGLDIYYDSSMNILIGDRQYMLSHNIKVKTDVNLTGAVKGADRSVIYMAFDGIPKIGFIISSKIKDSFIGTLKILKSCGVDAAVKTYEPQINEVFFESNKIEFPISVIKPSVFEDASRSNVSDSYIVSDEPYDLCRALEFSKVASKEYNVNRKIKKAQSIIGFVSACILALLSFLPSSIIAQADLHLALRLSFIFTLLLMAIPNVIQIIRIFKRK